ncbi:MAG: nuclear transport factor 2 family protein [Variibacter sp.]|nr:nuclear transport factor 2 family protein [Variibacter sp.]
MSNGNIALVQSLYEAFGRGEIASIVKASAPTVDWCMVGTESDYPGFVPRTGPAGVQEFFRHVAELWDFSEFTPQEFFASGDTVVVLGQYAAKLKKNGRSVRSEWVHVFAIRNGRLVKFREFTDTAQVAAAWRG